MSRSIRARWWYAAAWCAAAVVVAVEVVLLGHPVLAVPATLALLVVAYRSSPLLHRRGHTHWAALQRQVRDGAVVVYWRPGCPYCARLRARLRMAGIPRRRVCWVDIWEHPEGAAYVRDLNDGAETVPTVILPDGTPVTNPSAQQVVEALAVRARTSPAAPDEPAVTPGR